MPCTVACKLLNGEKGHNPRLSFCDLWKTLTEKKSWYQIGQVVNFSALCKMTSVLNLDYSEEKRERGLVKKFLSSWLLKIFQISIWIRKKKSKS
jgi:hypothetical protein